MAGLPNAGAPRAADAPFGGVVLPVGPASDEERQVVQALAEHARRMGVRKVRVHGHPGGARAAATERASLVATAACLAVAILLPTVALPALGILLVLAGARLLGGRGLGALLPRRPSWSLVLGLPGPDTRRVWCTALDRALPDLPWRAAGFATAAAAIVVVLVGGPEARAAGAGLTGVLALATLAARPDEGGAEAAAAAALCELARGLPDDEVAIVAGSSALDGAGVLAVLDWYAVDPDRCLVGWLTGAPGRRLGPLRPPRWWDHGRLRSEVGDTPGVASLAQAGWRVERLGDPPGAAAVPVAEILEALGRTNPKVTG